MDKKLKVAVVGMGSRGRYLANAFAKHPKTNVMAVCDTNDNAMKITRKIFGNTVRYYKNQETMCEKENFQIGIVSSWEPSHKQNAMTFLKNNVHVYLEKPMAQTIEDCDNILRTWEKSTKTLMVGLELRYCTLIQKMKQLLDSGVIGDIKTGMAVDNVSVGRQYYFHGKQRKKEFVKSLILEKGTHTLDLMNWFIGSNPIRVFGEAGIDVFGGDEDNNKKCINCSEKDTCPYFIDTNRFVMDYGEEVKMPDGCVWAREIDVEDNSIMTIRYENGAKITYNECHFTPDYNRHFTLIGNKGRMYGFYNNAQEFVIQIQQRHSSEIQEYHPPKVQGAHGGGDPRILEQFITHALKDEHVCPGAVDARNSAAIAIAAAQSCETHQPVNIPKFEFVSG